MQKESKQPYNPITLTWAAPPGPTLGPVNYSRLVFVVITTRNKTCYGIFMNWRGCWDDCWSHTDRSTSICWLVLFLADFACSRVSPGVVLPCFFGFYYYIVTLLNWWCVTGWFEWTFLLWLSRIRTGHSCTHMARRLCHYDHDTSFREKTPQRQIHRRLTTVTEFDLWVSKRANSLVSRSVGTFLFSAQAWGKW